MAAARRVLLCVPNCRPGQGRYQVAESPVLWNPVMGEPTLVRNLRRISAMNHKYLAVTVGLVAFTMSGGVAKAACPNGTYLNSGQLITTLNGKYVCAKRQVGGKIDIWNEFHRGVGAGPFPVIDYKKGPNDPVDPSKPVGTYVINNDDTVSYNYGDPDGPYSYRVRVIASPGGARAYQFCNIKTSEVITASISGSPDQATCRAP